MDEPTEKAEIECAQFDPCILLVNSRERQSGYIAHAVARTGGTAVDHCCEMLQEAVEGEAIVSAPKREMRGRILNEVDSDYAVRSPEDRPNLYLINFCPFCGRALSRTVWNAEKKK